MNKFNLIEMTLGSFEFFILGLSLAVPLVLLIVALVDILKNDFKGTEKLIWASVVILVPYLGFVLYFFIGTDQKIEKNQAKEV
jgi:uncharacterized BrkB/YihY/UPF0761 family membrane protein